jgi:hypothetical protein
MSDMKTYQFVIKDFTPETMPLSRLVEYYSFLSRMFGDIDGVHLVSIEESSHKNVLKIDSRAEDAFFGRVDGIRDGTASKVVLAARDGINLLVSEDNTSADFISDRGERVIKFKASGAEVAERVRIRDSCDFVGKLYHFSGKDSRKVSIRIDTEQYGSVSGAVSEKLALEPRGHTLDFIRLMGRADWSKVGDGPWLVSNFEVENFELVQKASLRKAVDDIRQLGVNWVSDPLGFLRGIADETGGIQ